MRNILLEISYLGGAFLGFQKQKTGPTVQGLLESALGKITGEKIRLIGSGRTDRGAHAFAQVCNFYTGSTLAPLKFKSALNALLPSQIRINRAEEVDLGFHARKSSRGKVYMYCIWIDEVMSPFLLGFVYHFPYPLNFDAMRQALSTIEGQHDFCSFAKAGTHEGLTVRSIMRAELIDRSPLLCFLIAGSGFLQHMVRTIVGTVLEIGRGKLFPEKITEILERKDRKAAGPTVPACGLYLVKVLY
ncbi:MAG: tRNA pseudouridine(38-40) synthase TruA [bacterium]